MLKNNETVDFVDDNIKKWYQFSILMSGAPLLIQGLECL